jgi:hypothetical protein
MNAAPFMYDFEVETARLTERIAHKTKTAKNRLHDKAKNRPQDRPKNRPNIINPVPLCGLFSETELKEQLRAHGQTDWCTRVRTCGLLLIIDFVLRSSKNRCITISGDLARSYISKLRTTSHPDVLKEPLPLLCKIGVLKLKRPAVFFHVRTSAVYELRKNYLGKQRQIMVMLPPKLARKRESAEERREQRLNRKYKFRAQLRTDLNAISFAPAARPIIANGFRGKGFHNLRALTSAIDSGTHFVRVSERGQITTSLGSCPRELQSHLLLLGCPMVWCDISNAHWNFLPLILAKRLDRVSGVTGRQSYINDGWREHNRLVTLLSDSDFYRTWCVDPRDEEERDGKKNILNVLLNQKNQDCEQNVLYRKIRAEFPLTFRIIEDIKRKDNRNLAKQLQRFMADAIAAALFEVQCERIAAIPHVDALICQQNDREQVCEVIGRKIFEATGVCCAVGGIRYSPLTEIEEQALAFDEIAPSNDGMTYDNWEALRIVKCVAALKLMRRCPPLFVLAASFR